MHSILSYTILPCAIMPCGVENGHASSYLRGDLLSTGASPRCVNPTWKQTFQLSNLEVGERLVFRIIDHTHLSESASLPLVIASASMPIGTDFEGFIDMNAPEMEGGNGNPVLKIDLRFFDVPAEPATPDPDQGQGVWEFGSDGVRASCGGVPAASAPPPPSEVGSDMPAPPPQQAVRGSLATSSVFWIDFDAINEAIVRANKAPMQNLVSMQRAGHLWPLPPMLWGNYLPLAVGWDVASGDWHKNHIWPGTSAALAVDPEVLKQTTEAMGKLAANPDNVQWCEGVRVCQKFLEHLKDIVVAAQQSQLQQHQQQHRRQQQQPPRPQQQQQQQQQ